jgi:SNF2 family DNA or RNA helicase
LTCADTVIIFDCDFNPAADKQAMDRCHRMGQCKPVRVIKLAAQRTVDERIVQIASAKAGQRAMHVAMRSNADDRLAATADVASSRVVW